jgi:sugar phosphate isomerase/epimerase
MESLLKLPGDVPQVCHEVNAGTIDNPPTKPWLSRLAISEMTTIRWSLLDDIVHLRAEGLEAIAVWRRKTSEFGEEKAVELIRDSGLTVASVSCAGGFTGHGGHSFRAALDDGLEALRLAGELQAGCLVVVSGARAGHTWRHARRLLRDALVALGDFAARVNVPIALQPRHPRSAGDWSFLTSLDATLEVLQDCQHPFVGLAFDVFHLSHERDLAGRVADALPWIRTVQLSDASASPRSDHDRLLPGEGCLPLASIVEQLEAGGYQGCYNFEVWSEDIWNQDFSQLARRCRDSFQELVGQRHRRPVAADS